jgi:hypothetical protein
MYISPVESELMNIRPFESSASPTGRKQLSGHCELSWLVMISLVDVVLSGAATGEPLLNAMADILYPAGSVRSLLIIS